ncbi:MAG: DegT/DnrJ/EryC1/StrS family aminotransferase [Desulfovibrio sp.]|nr:DegT/DnrJ/EryC1/StrS family aminotransferase [Desulfovibrio sp.]MBI4958477.1 DegT/DnrJ/EryC1/StrS family aminotransferase [Desulfovibrio sp.]
MDDKNAFGPLALEGGKPVRTLPLPWELPGSHYIGQEELDMLRQVVESRSPFRYYGPDLRHMVDHLEDAFRSRYGRAHALGVNSGTAALHIALAAIGVGPGDEVLVPGYMWVSCLSAVVRLGAIPRLVDIDDTFCMCPDDLKKKIGPRSKAIMCVHMSGAPGHIDQISEIARGAGIALLEDCAQANGSSLKGKRVGTFGDIAIMSFQLNKNMTAGEGGMIVCDDEGLYNRAFAVHDLGYARDASGRLDVKNEACQLWGIGSRMSEITGAFALAQEKKLDRITGAMRSAKWKIRRALEGTPGLAFRRILDPEGDSGPFLITMHPSAEYCQRFSTVLKAEGIKGQPGGLAFLPMEEWGLHWHFNNQSLVRKTSLQAGGFPWSHPANAFAAEYSYGRGTLPRCDDLCARSSLLTVASCLSEQDIDDIITAFKKVAAHLAA